jgi:TolB protein
VIELDTGHVIDLTNDRYSVLNAHWSPDGRRLTFITRGEFGEIYVVDADGENLQSLIDARSHAADAIWSPDGTQVALYLGGDGGGTLSIMNVRTDEVRILDGFTLVEGGPAWSPDGRWVLFTSGQVETGLEVYVLDVVTFTVHNLSNHPDADRAPVWWSGEAAQ